MRATHNYRSSSPARLFASATETSLRERKSVAGLPADVDGWIERFQAVARDPRVATFAGAAAAGARAVFGGLALIESASQIAVRYQEKSIACARVANATTPDSDTREILELEQSRLGRLVDAARKAKAAVARP